MKRKYLILILVILALSINNKASSQTCTGFMVGSNFSQLSGVLKDTYDTKISRFGGTAGIFWNYTLNSLKETSFEFGAFYSQQGNIFQSQYYLKGAKVTYRVYNKLDYILIPLTWKEDWGDIYTKAGFYGEILAQSDSYAKTLSEYRDTIGQPSIDTVNSFIDKIKPYDFGFNVGIGYNTVLSEQFDFFVDVSYKLGLTSVHPTYDPEKVMRNSIFCISVGVILRGSENRYGPRRR